MVRYNEMVGRGEDKDFGRFEFLDALLHAGQVVDGRPCGARSPARGSPRRSCSAASSTCFCAFRMPTMVSDFDSSSCRLPASDMLRTRSVRMRCLDCVGEDADEAFPAGEALHVLEFGAEHVGRVLQPDDQVGDVAFHHLLLLDHVLDAGVLDVEVGGADLLRRSWRSCRARCRTARSWSASPRRPALSWQFRHRNSAVSPWRTVSPVKLARPGIYGARIGD